jgi:hypothetical protein
LAFGHGSGTLEPTKEMNMTVQLARKNLTDLEQNVLESVEASGGILTFEEKKTRVVSRGRGGAENVAFKAGTRCKNAGVVMPASDRPGKFLENTIGKG